MSRHAWRLPPLGPKRAVSRMRYSTSSGTGSARNSRTAPVVRKVSIRSTATTVGRQTGVVDDHLPQDTVGLLEGIATTRAIRRYRDEPVPPEALRAILFAATRAPSGSNRQPFRFVVLTDGPKAHEAKALIAGVARRFWDAKRQADGYDTGSGAVADSPKARMARTMQEFVDRFEQVPVLILPVLVRYRPPTSLEGASVYPACQNLLLAARAPRLRRRAHRVASRRRSRVTGPARTSPDEVFMAATITLGRPVGSTGPCAGVRWPS